MERTKAPNQNLPFSVLEQHSAESSASMTPVLQGFTGINCWLGSVHSKFTNHLSNSSWGEGHRYLAVIPTIHLILTQWTNTVRDQKCVCNKNKTRFRWEKWQRWAKGDLGIICWKKNLWNAPRFENGAYHCVCESASWSISKDNRSYTGIT